MHLLTKNSVSGFANVERIFLKRVQRLFTQVYTKVLLKRYTSVSVARLRVRGASMVSVAVNLRKSGLDVPYAHARTHTFTPNVEESY